MPYPYDGSAPAKALYEAQAQPTPLGPMHLHYVHRDGSGRWLVRKQGSPLCGTPRCRKVYILEEHKAVGGKPIYLDIPLGERRLLIGI